MAIEEMAAIVTAWIQRGILSNDDRARLKSEYIRLFNLPPEGCKTCETFYLQMKVELRTYLKANGFLIMSQTKKYMLGEDVESVRLPFTGLSLILEGEETDGTRVLTNELGDELLATYPDLSEIILLNPKYVEPKTAQTQQVKPETVKRTANTSAATEARRAKSAAKKAAAENAQEGDTPPVDTQSDDNEQS